MRAEVRFTGRVQGVFFRDFTQRSAWALGVTGWVMNMPDGSVKAVFEGKKERIEELVHRLRTQHPSARVDKVEINWADGSNEFEEFEIRHL